MSSLPRILDFPAWYSLSIHGEMICFSVHPDAFWFLSQVSWEDSLLIDDLYTRLDIPNFIPPDTHLTNWGFGSVVQIEKNIWYENWLQLPEAEADHQTMQALQATVAVLAGALGLFGGDFDTESNTYQLFEITDVRVDLGKFDGASISINLCPPLCQWLATQPEGMFYNHPITDVMRSTHLRLFGKKSSFDRTDFNFSLRHPKYISLGCPGNSCELLVDANNDPSLVHTTYLIPHNIDNPVQQFTLLAGVIKMSMLARKAGY